MPNIIISNQKKIEVIEKVCHFFEAYYPEEWEWLKGEMKKLRQVSRSGYSDPQGRFTYVGVKVPTILVMAVQRILPEFGKDMGDLALLTKVCKDMDAHVPIHKDRQSLLIPASQWDKIYGAKSNVETPHDVEETEEGPDPQSSRDTASPEGADYRAEG